MRIGIDYTSAVRQRAGIGRYTRELVAELLLSANGHQYTIFAATGGLKDGEWRSDLRREGVRFRCFPLSDDWLARLWHRLRLPIPVEVVTGFLDVFYSPDFALPPTVPATKTLLTVHDLSFVRHPDTFVPSLRGYLEEVVPRSIDRADLVLADSAHTRSDLISLFGVAPNIVNVVYPGVDSRFRPQSNRGERERIRARYGIEDQPYVLSVGTLQPRKNYVRLIDAFMRMRAEVDPGVQLLIAGERGWLCDRILAEANKHESVRLLGFVSDEDLPALYRGASLFAFASLYEGFGLPVLEAMACGVPVVCSDASSLPEVAGDAALLVNPCAVDELAHAMSRVLREDSLRQGLADRGLAQAARFTWQRSARQVRALIESLRETV